MNIKFEDISLSNIFYRITPIECYNGRMHGGPIRINCIHWAPVMYSVCRISRELDNNNHLSETLHLRCCSNHSSGDIVTEKSMYDTIDVASINNLYKRSDEDVGLPRLTKSIFIKNRNNAIDICNYLNAKEKLALEEFNVTRGIQIEEPKWMSEQSSIVY